jgi:hypothetical protein
MNQHPAIFGLGVGAIIACVAFIVIERALARRLRRNPPRCVQGLKGNTAVICAWCPDKAAGDAWAARLDLQPSHTICRRCREQYLPSIKNR